MSGEVIFGLRKGDEIPTLSYGFCPYVQLVQVCNIDKNNTQSEYIAYVFVLCYTQFYMYTSLQIITAEQDKYIGIEFDTCLNANV